MADDKSPTDDELAGTEQPFVQHLIELRDRLLYSAYGIGAIFAVLVFYPGPSALYDLLAMPLVKTLPAGSHMIAVGVVSPFLVPIKVSVLAAFGVALPWVLYQVWAFVAPGLVAKEKRYALAFVAVSLPLFLTGTALGYFVWPKGIEVLLSFTPKDQDITNILDVANVLSMEIKVMLVFGLSFLLPVVVVGLNMAGVVRGYQLKKARKGVVFGAVVLSAVATPTTDPFSMMALGVPIVGMFLIAEVICRAWDKKRGISEETAEEFAIDLEDGK